MMGNVMTTIWDVLWAYSGPWHISFALTTMGTPNEHSCVGGSVGIAVGTSVGLNVGVSVVGVCVGVAVATVSPLETDWKSAISPKPIVEPRNKCSSCLTHGCLDNLDYNLENMICVVVGS